MIHKCCLSSIKSYKTTAILICGADMVIWRILISIIFAMGIFPGFAYAGWNSSGGEDFNNLHNPWFVRNTPIVHYCVALDSSSFSADRSKVDALISKAFSYWNDQFQKGGSNKVRQLLGTHEFKKNVQCDGSEEIKFQFGYGTLNQRQMEYLKDPSRHIGIAVRTEYDAVNLKGKGFVFFASDLGPHKIRTDGLVEKPWNYDGLLYRSILHEIGHVLGLPHIGDGLMSETYLERILNRLTYKLYSKADDLVDFFNPPLESSSCKVQSAISSFFQLPSEMTCLHLRYNRGSASSSIEVFGSRTEEADKVQVGRIDPVNGCKPLESVTPDINVKMSMTVRFDERQKIYSKDEIGIFETFVLGPAFVEFGCSGNYETANKTTMPVYFRIGPGFHQILGTVDGSIQTVYNAKINFMFGN
jgi:hypothetical protein